ncbi:MAG TPA: choice-of-anchor V domain-containing protein [Candidatus Limnocylindria bacterium]|nr:choice-of-anchor V domain-containing protein [Candidatus Limnocylindria bacterium]
MRRRIVRATVLIAVVCFATAAFAFSIGPLPSKTGAPSVAGRPAEPLCTQCHQGNAPNSPGGMLEILDVPERYEPGVTYPMRVRLTFGDHPELTVPKWGFQITSVHAGTGRGIGGWVHSPELKVVSATSASWPGRQYLEHGGDWTSDTASVHYGDMGPVEWQFAWTAPPLDSGAVYFFAAGNAANGDGCSFCGGDFIFTARDTILPPDTIAVDVPWPSNEPFVNLLEAPSPNPFNQCVDLSFTVASSGHVDLSIYDVQGRKVRTLMKGWHEAGPGSSFWNGKQDDGAAAANGVYFVRLRAPGLERPMVHRLTLSR